MAASKFALQDPLIAVRALIHPACNTHSSNNVLMPEHDQTRDSSAGAQSQDNGEEQEVEKSDKSGSYMAVVFQKNRLGVAWYDAMHGEVRIHACVSLPCCCPVTITVSERT
jgi:hypothetical protein